MWSCSMRASRGDKSPYTQRYFEDGGSGGFETAYAFVTQPLGVRTAGRNDDGARADDGDPLVLWRAFPDGWVLARKPTGRSAAQPAHHGQGRRRGDPRWTTCGRPSRQRSLVAYSRACLAVQVARGNRVSPWSHDFVGFAVVGCRRRAVGSASRRPHNRGGRGRFTLVYRSSLKSATASQYLVDFCTESRCGSLCV